MSVVGRTSPFCANLNEHHAGLYQTNTFLPTWSDEYFSKRIVDLSATDRMQDANSLVHAYVRARAGLTSGKDQPPEGMALGEQMAKVCRHVRFHSATGTAHRPKSTFAPGPERGVLLVSGPRMN